MSQQSWAHEHGGVIDNIRWYVSKCITTGNNIRNIPNSIIIQIIFYCKHNIVFDLKMYEKFQKKYIIFYILFF